MHGAQPLILNDTMSERAQQWSDHLASMPYPNICLNHSGILGENLYYEFAPKHVSEQVLADNTVVKFYEEIKQYDYKKPGFKVTTGHFSQLVQIFLVSLY